MSKKLTKLAFWCIIFFGLGMMFQFKLDEARVNRTLEFATQRDIPAVGMPNGVIEVDCMTPESYREIEWFFSQDISDSNLVSYGLNNLF